MDVSVARRHITIGLRTLSCLATGNHLSDRLVVFRDACPLNAALRGWLDAASGAAR